MKPFTQLEYDTYYRNRDWYHEYKSSDLTTEYLNNRKERNVDFLLMKAYINAVSG
jgi:hypothetical protein